MKSYHKFTESKGIILPHKFEFMIGDPVRIVVDELDISSELINTYEQTIIFNVQQRYKNIRFGESVNTYFISANIPMKINYLLLENEIRLVPDYEISANKYNI